MKPEMSEFTPEKEVLKYYLFIATMSQGFIIPITVEYMLSRGLTFAEVGTIEGIFMAGWVLWELPTGYLGDRIGRRNGLIVGSVLTFITLISLIVSRSFLAFAVVYSIWAISVTFRSGTSDAWLYDLLKERFDEEEFSRIKGRGSSLYLLVTAATSVAGGYLASIDWYLPFLANSVLIAGNVVVLLSFPEPDQQSTDDEEEETFTIVDALPVIREQFTRPPLRSFIVYTALFFGLVEVASTFIQPISTSVGVRISHLGWLYAGLSLFAAGLSYYTGDIKERLGIRRWFYLAPILVGAFFAVMMIAPLAAIPAFFLMRGINTVTQSFKSQYINDLTGSVGRATVLSAAAMLAALFAAVLRVVGGMVAEVADPITMLGGFGIAFVAATVVLFAWENPVSTPADQSTPAAE